MTGVKARILVVDDSDAGRYAVVRPLRGEGHEVLEAVNGRSALDMARREPLDLMVLDVRLPDILGFEVAEQIRSDPGTESIAILQISASFTAADAQAQGLRSGADAYLIHPVDPQVLCATVLALLRMRNAEQRAKLERARAQEAQARAEEERAKAAASESRYRFLADMVPQLVWSCDATGKPDYFNRRWFEFTGDSTDAVHTTEWAESLHPDDQAAFKESWARSLATGRPLEIECRRWSPAASDYRWLLIRGVPMKDANGAVIRWFGTSTDIQPQKEVLAERERLVEQLREEAARKNEFLAVLSHELRNPLAPIRNSVYILERATPDGEQANRAREVIDRQVQHMTQLVDDLLDVARIARGKIQLRKEQVDLFNIVRRTAEDHRDLLRRAGIELELRLTDGHLPIHGDPTRLTQVVGNLLQNVAKFTPAGGRVSVSLSREGAELAIIRVRDTGAGIAPDTLGHLFEPFVQGERTLDRSGGGLGLGLALAKGIVELHGGSIAAASEGPGKGAEFTITLPIEREAAALPSPEADCKVLSGPKRVLIIEDIEDAAESLREALSLSDHVVEVAHEAVKGIDLAKAFRPDVVLCDIGLPRIDGYEVARRLRREPSLHGVLLVALSGYALQDDIDKSREAGFDLHMAKPPRLDELERLLGRAPRRDGPDRPAVGTC